jgi:hypothetical protein
VLGARLSVNRAARLPSNGGNARKPLSRKTLGGVGFDQSRAKTFFFPKIGRCAISSSHVTYPVSSWSRRHNSRYIEILLCHEEKPMLARKSPSIVFAILVTATLCVASCTTTRYENVRLKTARAIGGVTSEQVAISNFHTWMKSRPSGFALAVSPVYGNWEAETPKGHYQCQSEDMLKRSANCVKR